MRACSILVSFVVCFVLFVAGASGDGVYEGERLPAPEGHADFGALVDGQPLSYDEAGLRFDLVGGVAFKSNRIGFTGTDNLYPGGGAPARLCITRTDGAPIEVIQLQVSDGFQTSPVYLWATLMIDGSPVAHFDLDQVAGDTIGFVGPFDELRIGAYQSPAARDSHDPEALNALAIDNVCHGDRPACLCEVTGDDCVDLMDLLQFLTGWFASDPATDVTGDGVSEIGDLLAFLSCWYGATGGLCVGEPLP